MNFVKANFNDTVKGLCPSLPVARLICGTVLGKPRTSTYRYRVSSIYKRLLHRKEVIQPQVPLRLPCYDFIPVTNLTLGRCVRS